jgi:8-oxo-dGTP pyrophosphatase MutT (NUDIX family)
MENQYLHEVVMAAIIVKDGKYLILKRSPNKKRFPSMWTIPGGRLETNDYTSLPKDTKEYWYNVLEKTLKREVLEESGLEIENITYVTSLATVHADGNPSIAITCKADYKSGEVKLQEGETVEAAWVTLEEAKSYDLIDGIYDELAMADTTDTVKKSEWKRSD